MSKIEKQNFISADLKSARNSYGEFFTIGNIVGHESESAGTAMIQSFEIDTESNEIKAITDKGWAHIDFITKL